MLKYGTYVVNSCTCLLDGTGALILLDQLDYETTKTYELTVRASDIVTGSVADTVVHIAVEVTSRNL